MDASLLKNGLSTKLKKGVEVRIYGANNVMQITTSCLNNEDATTSEEEVRNRLVYALKDITQLKQNNCFN